jgi:SpoVK/Ycf46/Vps4 family AAA+-type ATPase
VHAVANETGANLFNLTPSNTDGKYPGKKAYDMVHTVFKVAKALAPSVVWIDEVDTVFKSGKVKGATGEPPNRIAKQLVAVLTPKKGVGVIDPEDRVLVIGTSAKPYETEKPKDKTTFRDFFAKILYTPLPNYPSRNILWVHMLEKLGVHRPDPDEIQTPAHLAVLLLGRHLPGRQAHAHRAPRRAAKSEALPGKRAHRPSGQGRAHPRRHR